MERISTLHEIDARRVVLAQAIESSDTKGAVLSAEERAGVDDTVRAQAARAATDAGRAWTLTELLARRAQILLQSVQARSAALAALQTPHAWWRWLGYATPWLAFALGVLTDRIANPHQVDLLSLPLLGLVLWNLAMYAALAASAFGVWPGLAAPAMPWPLDGLRQRRAGARRVHAEIAATFYLRWHAVAAGLNAQRLRRVLHACAALWGAGVAASLFTRGLVVEYRVGWESTFLDANQVHAILRMLFMPVVALFPQVSFSVEEVARLRFGTTGGAAGGAAAGARWVYMYAGLLLLVVVLPRLVLAAVAWRRERTSARAVRLDLQQPYFQQLIAALRPAQVQLCIVADREEDKAALLRVLLRNAAPSQGPATATATTGGAAVVSTALATDGGDVLNIVAMPKDMQSAPETDDAVAPEGWMRRTWGKVRGAHRATSSPHAQALASLREQADVVLRVVRGVGELQESLALMRWMDKPLLVLLQLPGADAARQEQVLSECRAEMRLAGFPGAQALAFDQFARCWIQEPTLLHAIGRAVAPAKRQGYARLCKLWSERNEARLRQAMTAMAGHLVLAAREREEVRSPPLSLKSLVRSGERDADPRTAAMLAVAERLRLSDARATADLLVLHGLEKSDADALQHELQEKFVVREAVRSSRAGMAGAASGAAMGASVDLLTGGLTLGAAAAVGALAMGSAAFLAAAWRNKSTQTDTTVVELSDEMLQALVEAGLLRYLAVATQRGFDDEAAIGGPQPFWRSEVVAVVHMHRDALNAFWAQVRAAARASAQQGSPSPSNHAQPLVPLPLVELLQAMARTVLGNLHAVSPGSPSV